MFMVSSRDRSHSQRRDSLVRTYRQDAAACVSLSKSTMSKTRTGFRRAHCLAPGGRRRRLLSDRASVVSIGLFGFCDNSEKPQNFGRKNRRGLPREALKVRDDSIEAREHTHFEPKIKRLSAPGRRFNLSPARAGGGYLVAVPLGVNRSFSRTPGRSPDAIRIFEPGPRPRGDEERALHALSREAADVSEAFPFRKPFQGLAVPSDGFVPWPPFRAEAAI